jgi:hypothetical protein
MKKSWIALSTGVLTVVAICLGGVAPASAAPASAAPAAASTAVSVVSASEADEPTGEFNGAGDCAGDNKIKWGGGSSGFLYLDSCNATKLAATLTVMGGTAAITAIVLEKFPGVATSVEAWTIALRVASIFAGMGAGTVAYCNAQGTGIILGVLGCYPQGATQ